MSDEIGQSAAQALDKLSSALEASIKAMGALGDKYGPDVVDAGLWAVRMKGIGTLIVGIVCIFLSVALYKLAKYFWSVRQKTVAAYRANGSRGDDGDGAGFLAIASGILAGFCTLIGILNVVDVWTYVAIFEPKLWVAKRLLGL